MGAAAQTPAIDFGLLTWVSMEGVVRLESTLAQIPDEPEYRAILAKMLDLCRGLRRGFFDHFDLFRDAISGEVLSPINELKIRQVLRHSAGAFLALHETCLFLPRDVVRREMLSCCECLFRKEFDLAKISILLTSVFNAFEYSLDDVMRTLSIDVFRMKVPNPADLPFGHVMELAVVDRDSPLSWPVLAHEFGHYIDDCYGLSKRAAKDFVDRTFKSSATAQIQRTFERICGEVVADLTAYYVLGPSSIAPILVMSLLASLPLDRPMAFDNIHPVPATRFDVLNDLAKHDGMTTEWLRPIERALAAEELQKGASLTPAERKSRETVDAYIKVLCDDVKGTILSELGKRGLTRFSGGHFDRAGRLAAQLRIGLPIGAAKQLSDIEIAARLAEGDPRVEGPSYAARYSLLKDLPVSPAEVLTAGWLHKVERIPHLIRDAYTKATGEEAFHIVGSFLDETDSLLLTSLEVISVLEKFSDTTGL
jgi:hypothetical protein